MTPRFDPDHAALLSAIRHMGAARSAPAPAAPIQPAAALPNEARIAAQVLALRAAWAEADGGRVL
jgi:hypothetical protein